MLTFVLACLDRLVVDHKVEFLVHIMNMVGSVKLSGLAKQSIWWMTVLWCTLVDLCLLLWLNMVRVLLLFLTGSFRNAGEVWNAVSSL